MALDPPEGVKSGIGVGVIFPEAAGLEDSEDEVEYIGLPIRMFDSDDYDEEEIALLKTDRRRVVRTSTESTTSKESERASW